jgi:hypothetical protein
MFLVPVIHQVQTVFWLGYCQGRALGNNVEIWRCHYCCDLDNDVYFGIQSRHLKVHPNQVSRHTHPSLGELKSKAYAIISRALWLLIQH